LTMGQRFVSQSLTTRKIWAQGAATVMIDAKDNHLELRHDPQRNLLEIRTPHGHWIRFAYDDQSRVKRAEDDAGDVI
jgi:YD repeat-containing protein